MLSVCVCDSGEARSSYRREKRTIFKLLFLRCQFEILIDLLKEDDGDKHEHCSNSIAVSLPTVVIEKKEFNIALHYDFVLALCLELKERKKNLNFQLCSSLCTE